MLELKIVGGYIRVSTQEQSTKGLSLETQKAEIKEYCRKNGYKLHKIYVDKGITARKNLYKREGFMQMIEDVQDGTINHIVVLRLDRFFRNVYDYHKMMNEYLIPNKCGWSAVKENYDTTTTNGRLMINLRLSIAEQECDQDSDRIKDVFEKRVKDGYIIHGSLPFGIANVEKRAVPGEQAYIVKDIFDTFLATCSARQTLIEINARHNLNFDYNRLLRVLKTEMYIGRYRGNENFCQPIIDKEDFGRVQLELSRNARVKKNKRFYIFSNMVVCGECGHNLSGSTISKAPDIHYYRCNNHWYNHKCLCSRHFREDEIEKYLVANVKELLKDYTITIKAKEKELSAQKGNRVQIEKKIDRLTELYVNEVINLEELKKRKAELEAQIVDEVAKPKQDITKIETFLNSGFENVYYDLAPEERRTLWRSVVKSITLKEDSIAVSFL